MNYRPTQKKSKTGYYSSCPRCGWHSLEHLETHNHCVNCLYYEPNFEDISLTEAIEAEKLLKSLEQKNPEEKSLKKNSVIKITKSTGDVSL